MAKHRSFTRASVELDITEAAISQRVKKLEGYLGVKLYEARGGRVQLTPAGERTFDRATGTFDELELFERSIGRADESVEITLCTPDSVMRYLLPDVIDQFSHLHPLARLRVLARSGEQCAEAVRSNEADIAIIASGDFPDDLKLENIVEYPGYVILPKQHPLARLQPANFWPKIDESIVRQYPLIILEGQRCGRPLREALANLGLPLVVQLEVGTIDTLKYLVHRGMGIAAVSGLCLTAEDFANLAIIEAPRDVGAESRYALALRHNKHQSLPLRTLIDLIPDVSRLPFDGRLNSR